MGENDVNTAFCRHCNTWLVSTGNLNPLQQIVSEGAIYGKAVEGKPKLIVLIGIWVIFLMPMILGALFAFSVIAEGEKGADSFIFYLFSIASSCFSFVMIYRGTKNYFKKSEE
jgi:hypothetical protein